MLHYNNSVTTVTLRKDRCEKFKDKYYEFISFDRKGKTDTRVVESFTEIIIHDNMLLKPS